MAAHETEGHVQGPSMLVAAADEIKQWPRLNVSFYHHPNFPRLVSGSPPSTYGPDSGPLDPVSYYHPTTGPLYRHRLVPLALLGP